MSPPLTLAEYMHSAMQSVQPYRRAQNLFYSILFMWRE